VPIGHGAQLVIVAGWVTACS